MSSYGERMKKLMVERGISTEQLAKTVGVSARSINMILNGEIQHPRKSNEISFALGTTHEYLMYGREKERNETKGSWLASRFEDLLLNQDQIKSILKIAKLMSDANKSLKHK
ncbi:helix-turn-helix domain-containing protein [Vibrio parahaemolyticus]